MSHIAGILTVLIWGIAFSQPTEVDQTTAPIGQFFDPSSMENISKIQGGVQSAKDAKTGVSQISQGKFKDFALGAFQKYQNSKLGLMNFLRKIQDKTSSIIGKAAERVDKWRTTVPKIKAYADMATRYADDSYDFAKTFEMSDLWDIDRNFSMELEWRIGQGRRLGLSVWDYLVSRVNRVDFLKGIEKILFPDIEDELSRSSLGGNRFLDNPSPFEKVPIFVLGEAMDALAAATEMAEKQYSPSKNAPGLSNERFDNKRLREALFNPKSGYTDEVALRQDILQKQYETAVKRSILRDKQSRLELLWGRLAALGLEEREVEKKKIATEMGILSGTKLNPDAFILNRFGLSGGDK